MSDITIRVLTQEDLSQASELMSTDSLRPEGILAPGTRYWGAFDDGRLVGMIGCEYENNCGLIRSALVGREYRGKGLMKQLTGILIDDARSRGLRALYLFSTDAAPYWLRAGFKPVPTGEAVDALSHAPMVILFAEPGWLPTEKTYAIYL